MEYDITYDVFAKDMFMERSNRVIAVTGRWMITTNDDNSHTMSVECVTVENKYVCDKYELDVVESVKHNGFLYKRFVDEHDILIRKHVLITPEPTEQSLGNLIYL